MVKGLGPLIVLIIIAGIIMYRRQRRLNLRLKHQLGKRQRAVSIWQQALDPVVEFAVVGSIIWTDLQHGWLPWIALIIGVVIGLPLGAVRGRFMYVRSIGNSHKIVLERNAAEIGILLGLVVIKLTAHAISKDPTSVINLIAVGLLGIGLASSVGRVVYIVIRHYQSRSSETVAESDDRA